jgi:hypothetical protein
MYSSSESISAVLAVVVWGVGGAAVTGSRSEMVAGWAVRVDEAAEAAIFLLGWSWLCETVDASAAFRFLVKGGMVAVFKKRKDDGRRDSTLGGTRRTGGGEL